MNSSFFRRNPEPFPDSDNIRLLPTRKSYGFAVLLVLLWLTSANYNNNLGFLLTYLLGSIAMLSPFHTFRQLTGLTIRSQLPQPVFAGDTAQVIVLIENPTTRPRYQIRMQIDDGESVELALDSHQRCRVSLPIPTSKRGCRQIKRIKIYSTYPLGLCRANRMVGTDLLLWIYPKPVSESLCPVIKPEYEEGEKSDFHGFREYQPGDSLRQLHWKGLAKGQGLKTKLYQSPPLPNQETLWIDWERVDSQEVEEKLCYLSRWVLTAEQGHLQYGLQLPSHRLMPDQGPAHLHACLKQLASFPHGHPFSSL